jgi:muramoyltetrapeptide carboxypeptidase LdcA involved in peptidoglycan recycling
MGIAAVPLAAHAGKPATQNMKFPPRLKPNDVVALVSPAGAASSEQGIHDAMRNIESLGLRVKRMPSVGQSWGYLGGSD